MTAAMVAHVTTGLEALKSRGKLSWALGHTRQPNAGESDTVLAIVERIPDNNNGNLRLKLQFEGTPVGTPVS